MLVRNTSSSAQQQQQEEEEEQSSSINNNCTSTYLWCRYIINREEKTKSKREPFFHKAFAKRCGTSAGNFCKERGDDVSKMQNKLSLIFSPRSSSHSKTARDAMRLLRTTLGKVESARARTYDTYVYSNPPRARAV